MRLPERVLISAMPWVAMVGAGMLLGVGVNGLIAATLVSQTPLDVVLMESSPMERAWRDDINVLAYNRNLFNPAAVDAPDVFAGVEERVSLADGGERPLRGEEHASRLGYTLVGTMVAEEPQWSVAQLRATGSSEVVVREGESLAGGLTLLQIARTYVVLREADGGLSVLALGSSERHDFARDEEARNVVAYDEGSEEVESSVGSLPESALGMMRHPDSSLVRFEPEWSRASAGGFVLHQGAVLEQERSLAGAAIELGMAPVLMGGQVKGFRFTEVPDATLFSAVGLQPGDAILTINGRTPDSEQISLAFVGILGRRGEVTLSVERGGTVRQLQVWAER